MRTRLMFCMVFALLGTLVAQQGEGVISIPLEKLELGRGASLDDSVKVRETPSLKLSLDTPRLTARAEMELELDPEVDLYELSFYMKAENIVSDAPDTHGADVWLKPAKGGALRFSTRGTYKSDSGSFDWKKASYKVNVKRYLKERPAKIILFLTYASGNVWFDQITLSPVNAKTQAQGQVQGGFSFGLFPMCQV